MAQISKYDNDAVNDTPDRMQRALQVENSVIMAARSP